MDLEVIIGLEIHIQLKTKSKMFCSCANIFGDVKPNTAICPICLAYPGTLPVPNAQAIEWTQMLGAALDCKLALKSKFDRKSYFYPDLPKGYQISQFDQPFCGEGELSVDSDGETHVIEIERIHLEEDAAKNTHPAGVNYTLVDYNRAGTPLVEVVTKPSIKSPEAAKAFLQELQGVVRALKISDADMEKGQMRCDANISLREKGSNELNPKTEVKNINSFRFVEKALKHEIQRQAEAWKNGEPPKVESTRGYDSKTGTTTAQRTKEAAADYRYFPEPDIPPFFFSQQELDGYEKKMPEMPSAKRDRFKTEYGVSQQQASLLAGNSTLAGFLENTVSEIKQLDNDQIDLSVEDRGPLVKDAVNIILRDIREMVEDNDVEAKDIKITPANFAEMIVLIYQGKMSKNVTPRVLSEMQRTGGDPDHILSNLGLEQVSDAVGLEEVVSQVIQDNQEVAEKVKAGKESAVQFLMGQVMRETSGKANPGMVIKLIRQKLLEE
jgi:aspartyl-tRNA(Asn)/glutamyl-tRNA(Gln) amidotransferase subunit B